MWPALLMSAGFPPPKKVFGHGFLTKDGLKMGKALGNVLDPVALVDAYGADAVRFFFMREIRFGQVSAPHQIRIMRVMFEVKIRHPTHLDGSALQVIKLGSHFPACT